MKLKVTCHRIIRESGSEGLSFEIVIIKEGLSHNGTYYPKETLLKSRELFEGAKVAFYEFNSVYDHLSQEARENCPAGFPGQVVGLLSGIKFSKLSEGGHGLIGTMDLTESNRWLAQIFKLSLDKAEGEALGFSIDVLGESKKETVDGREVDMVESIEEVNEVTVVTSPAAGGRLERLVASVHKTKEKKAMKEKLLKLIMALRVNKLAKISLTESTDVQVMDLAKETVEEVSSELKESPELVSKLEEVMQAAEAGDAEKMKVLVAEAIEIYNEFMKSTTEGDEAAKKEAEEKAALAKKEADDKAAADAGKTPAEVIELQKKQESTDKAVQGVLIDNSQLRVRTMLAESKLPETTQERIKARFVDRVSTEADVKKEIDAERKYVASLNESLHPGGLTLELGDSGTDKIGDAIEGMIRNKDINKIPRFKGIHESFAKTDKVSPFDPKFKDRLWIGMVQNARVWDEKKALMKEAIQTSTWAEIFGDRLHKSMVAEYNEEGLEDWRKVVNISSAPDFLTQRVDRLGGYGTNMPVVLEAAAYTALTSPTDEEASYLVTKKGGIESVSMEAIKNDNLKAVQKIPKRLGRGAKNTLFQFVFDFVAGNGNIYDGNPYFDVGNHANLRTAALSYSEFNNVVIAMMDQAAYNEANFFPENRPKYILVPNELWLTATEIALATKSQSGARTETVENMFKEFSLEVIRLAYWTDANDWAVTADPARVPTIEIGFLDGNEQPELLQEAANSGSDFSNDQIRWKLRHVYGGAVVDYISAHKNVVA